MVGSPARAEQQEDDANEYAPNSAIWPAISLANRVVVSHGHSAYGTRRGLVENQPHRHREPSEHKLK